MNLLMQIARNANGFYRACCPALPGCVVYAESREEARSKLGQAVEGYLARLDETLPRELGNLQRPRQCPAA